MPQKVRCDDMKEVLTQLWLFGRQAPVGRSQGFTGGANPFLDPPRYIPPGGEDAPDLELRVREALYVLDVGLVRHRASAILDTGEQIQSCPIALLTPPTSLLASP